MFPSIESRLPFEGLICRAWQVFPVADSASDDHHSLALLIGDAKQRRSGAAAIINSHFDDRQSPRADRLTAMARRLAPLVANRQHRVGVGAASKQTHG
jgi:hypothetical protein